MPGTRQTRRPPTGIGLGVDASGGPVIDPTENVLALVDVEKAHAKAFLEVNIQRQDELRQAEMTRVNDLRAQRKEYEARIESLVVRYETRIESIQTAATSANSSLLATQLANIENTLGVRITDLEKKSWEGSGKTSVADPALAKVIEKMTETVAALSTTATAAGAAKTGRDDVWKNLVVAATLGGALVALIQFVATRVH